MPTNSVTVTANFGSSGEGPYMFWASGSLMDDTNVAIVTPVITGAVPPGGSGLLSVSLLASDNFSAGELLWNVSLHIQGIQPVNWNDFPVNFALGASQNLFTILKADGWTPITT